ncbi:MAG: hypothetical protein HY978_02480 [Candidatus Liptonbacteria bacterium]|nr:hypothetical protein [Candidatus Liptonbacteria bacterium]
MNGFSNGFVVLTLAHPVYAGVFFYAFYIFLGNIAGFTALWLAFRGHFGPWGLPIILTIVFIADLSGDFLWYSLGRFLSNTRFAGQIKHKFRFLERLEAHFDRRGARWIFLSKFLYATTFPILFTAGWTKIDFRKYFRVSLFAILAWLPIMTILAYALFSGLILIQATSAFHRVEKLFLVGLLLFLLLNYLLTRLTRGLVERKEGF